MDFSNTPIKQLIPQRPPFMMVDRVLSCDEADALTEFSIREDNFLFEDGVLLAAGVIENMAQSCAAWMGCVDMLQGKPIKIGHIGDARDATILRQPTCNETLHTHVHVIEGMFNLLLAEVHVTVGDETIATARLKLAKTDIEAVIGDR